MTSTYKIINSDNIEAMRKMESNSVHNCITDPPWGISFLSGSKGTTWDNFSPENIKKHRHNKNKAKEKETTKRYRSMMAGEYTNTCKADREYQRWTTEWATEAIRVQKEGGFLLALCGTRTYGRLCCGIQEAGYNIKDTITFLTAQGFPKSHKIITKMSEEDAETYKGWQTPGLKPAITFIIIAQKPKKLTYAKNMIKNQVGCYNIDACRIGIDKINTHDYAGGNHCHRPPQECAEIIYRDNTGRFPSNLILEEGQICDDLDKQSGIKKGKKSVKVKRKKGDKYNNGHYGNPSSPSNDYIADYREDEGGGASRFYKHIEQNQPSRFLFCSKANKKEKQAGLEDFEEQPLVEARIGCHGNKDKNICPTCKAPLKDGQTCKFHPKSTGSRHYQSRYIKCGKKFNGSPDTLCKCPGKKEYDVSAYKLKNNHPTVQPIKLLEYLISLVSYPGTTILDCFNGSGSTGCASMNLNKDYNYIGIEMNKHYCDISEARIAHWLKQTEEREEPKDIFAGEKKITIK